MAKVYVTQTTPLRIAKAADFGELVFMSDGERDDFVNMHPSKHNEGLLGHLADFLRNYDPEVDSILAVGSPYVQQATFWILGGLGFSKIRTLRWDNGDKCYFPLVLQVRKEMIDDRPR